MIFKKNLKIIRNFFFNFYPFFENNHNFTDFQMQSKYLRDCPDTSSLLHFTFLSELNVQLKGAVKEGYLARSYKNLVNEGCLAKSCKSEVILQDLTRTL